MNDITDELLEELSELETNTDFLNEKVEDAVTQKERLEHTPSSNNLSAAGLLLEACKLAQQAADTSHQSSEASLHSTNKQQTQIDELQENIISTRQTTRNIIQDSQSSKRFFGSLATTSILLLALLTAASGWILHQNQQTKQTLEQQIIDIIKTENTLNQRQLNLKINELATVIELSLNTAQAPGFDERLEEDYDNNERPVPAPSISEQLNQHQQHIHEELSKIKHTLEQQPAPAAAQDFTTTLTPKLNAIERQLNTQTAQLKALQPLLNQPANRVSPSQEHTDTPRSTQEWETLNQQIKLLTLQQQSLEQALEKLSDLINTQLQETKPDSNVYQYRNPYQYKN